ncbi:hypothetical protein RHGRI_019258 [Rhododendron griersonianum]|uniref:EF-hand domain-containing protein n=1 Tax=Rhododendron griersonianum TaxID=479676 RepID=A0AAV6JHA7_9ERIC|nr:hypothetical protein RHGRI_019258 [Rhododendron griersonianum]
MSENAPSDSDTQETDSSPSSSEELESPKNGGTQKKMTEYEKQRAKRIEENRARVEALGLRKMACSVMGSGRIAKEKKREAKGKRKGKMGEENDEEYRPEEEGDEEGSDNMFPSGWSLRKQETKKQNASVIAKKKHSTSKKFFDQNLTSNSDFVDDDEALFQAIALSLKDSTECSNVRPNEHSQSSNAHLSDNMINARKENAHIREDTGKRKRKKPVTSRVKMTEDEFLIHFFQFDEAGKGGITLRDLQRVAAAHDFTWTDKEMADMIYCFDSDGDGKLSLDDFRKIAGQCNMIQVSALL